MYVSVLNKGKRLQYIPDSAKQTSGVFISLGLRKELSGSYPNPGSLSIPLGQLNGWIGHISHAVQSVSLVEE